MKFVDERVAAFDENRLGFPSIQGCHAICFQTTRGLYGYHSLGSETKLGWEPLAARFANFVAAQWAPGEKGRGLYGCASVTMHRGYNPAHSRSQWKEELKGFARSLHWRHEIWGFNIANFDGGGYDTSGSAYIEYRRIGLRCMIFGRQWDRHEDVGTIGTDSGSPTGYSPVGFRNDKMPRKLTSSVGGGALYNIVPEKLR